MKKIKPLFIIFITSVFLNACGIADGLGGSRKKGNEEFLIEKKAPLIIPPSFEDLPEPGLKTVENTIKNKEEVSSVEKIIDQSISTNTDITNNESSSSVEKSIIEKINNKKIKELNLDKVIEEEKEIPKNEGFFKKLKNKFNKLEH
tara:strand:- start:1403 stop:1840 length:438 start_codon:yes stop_codon:yes gene_type:complete